MMNPYEKCPIFESEHYLLRLVSPEDAPGLLLVYSDEKSVPFFNSDNCGGDDFHYTTLKRMQEQIDFWLWEYHQKSYVRWTIMDRSVNLAIGSIELFNRKSNDFFNDCGLLRLDLRSDYERTETILEILAQILPNIWDLFGCQMVATKAPPFALQRKEALKQLGFSGSKERLIGHHDGKEYTDYYVLKA